MNKPSILVIAPRMPFPRHSGEQLRIYHTLCELTSRYDVTLVALIQQPEERDRIPDIGALGVDVVPVEHNRTKRDALRRFVTCGESYRVAKFVTPPLKKAVRDIEVCDSFDLVWIHFLETLPALPQPWPAPVVVDQHNADRRYWSSFESGSLAERLFSWVNQRRIVRFQRKVANQIATVISVSPEDADVTREWTDAPVIVGPNGVDHERFKPQTSASEAGKNIMFVGSLDVQMNIDAITWFSTKCFPEIRERHPDAVFTIVGRNPSADICTLTERPGIRLHANVPDVVPYYNDAGIVVAPFQFGGGTKLKVLEALSMARPIVTTPVGIDGINVTDGREAFIRERGESFQTAVAALLIDNERRDAFGERGRELVRNHYTWSTCMGKMVDEVESTILA